MIHINYPGGKTPDPVWLAKAAQITERLREAPDKAARDKIIDANTALWGEIKEWLESFSHSKCWFSEARDTCSFWQVEHFRPKKRALDPDRDGYWWLAFDYLNYRLCGGVPNVRKGSYFPLREGTRAAVYGENWQDESPVLLDPTELKDVALLTFAEGGMAVPAMPEGWLKERAAKSIERYKLNGHEPLGRARADVWNSCQTDAEQLDMLYQQLNRRPSQTDEQKVREIVGRLQDRIQPKAQFSSVARAFLAQYPKPWAQAIH